MKASKEAIECAKTCFSFEFGDDCYFEECPRAKECDKLGVCVLSAEHIQAAMDEAVKRAKE